MSELKVDTVRAAIKKAIAYNERSGRGLSDARLTEYDAELLTTILVAELRKEKLYEVPRCPGRRIKTA